MPDSTVSQNRDVMIVLAYLWVLAIVPLLVEKQDAEVQWHAKHGIVLMVAELVLLVLAFVLMITTVVARARLGTGCALSLVFVFAWVGILALHVVAILKGVNGRRLVVPGISEYANRF
jgi:uncharacterized membrane protein